MEINTGNYASFKRFVNEIGDLKVKKSIRTIGIIGYILAGVYFIIALLFNFFILVDAFVILGLTLAIHIAKNRVCAWLLVVYGGLNFFLSLIQNGKPAGYWILIVGIAAVIEFSRATNKYKIYFHK